MADQTFRALIQQVIKRLSMTAGTGVQIYAEDKIGIMLQDAFDQIFDDYSWSRFLCQGTGTLDGVTGVITTDISGLIKSYGDLNRVFFDKCVRPLCVLPTSINPFTLSGTRPLYYSESQDATRVFKVWPETSTGIVHFLYKKRPDAFTLNDVVPFDAQALVLKACIDYCADDSGSDTMLKKFQSFYKDRIGQLKAIENDKPITLNPYIRSSVMTDWYTL